MNYAVALFFEKEIENKLYSVMKFLSNNGVNDFMVKNHFRPHLTLGIFPSINEEVVEKLLLEIANRTSVFSINMSHYIFCNNLPAGIGLSPILNDQLINIHNDFYNVFAPCVESFKPVYLKNMWRPHCSLAQKIESSNELSKGLESITRIENDFTNVQVTEIGFGSTGPFTVVKSFALNGENNLATASA